jgi:hypothetical protein
MSAEIIATGGFNTGRLYTKTMQRIWWAQRGDGWLYFKDLDRLLSGWLKRDGSMPFDRPPSPEWIMRKYDGGGYESWAPPGESTASNPRMPDDFDFGEALRI